MKTVFEKIISREIPATIELENDYVIVIRDIAPKAPIHLLIIPKKPIPSLNAVSFVDAPYVQALIGALQKITHQYQLDQSGYRLIINHGHDGGQEIPHLHIHVLGGKKLPSF